MTRDEYLFAAVRAEVRRARMLQARRDLISPTPKQQAARASGLKGKLAANAIMGTDAWQMVGRGKDAARTTTG